MDVLSSQANLAGYKAVIESFSKFEKAIPMMMTAAGTISSRKSFSRIGAGVSLDYRQLLLQKEWVQLFLRLMCELASKEQVESLRWKIFNS